MITIMYDILFNSQGLLQEVRPLPYNALRFKGSFQNCYNNPCLRRCCTYAHSDLELQAWNKRKEEILNCKLKASIIILNGSYIYE